MGIYDGLKDAASVLKEAGKIEQYRQILEIQEKLLDMQNHIAEIDIENKLLKEKLSIKENLIPEGNFYYTIKDKNKDGPFCTCCWDSESKLVRLHTNTSSNRTHCPNCETTATPGRAIMVRGENSF